MESGSGNLSKLCSVSLLGQREGAGGGRMAKQESFSLLALTLTALDVWDGPGRRSNYLAGSFESAFLLERPRLLSVCTETEPNRTTSIKSTSPGDIKSTLWDRGEGGSVTAI